LFIFEASETSCQEETVYNWQLPLAPRWPGTEAATRQPCEHTTKDSEGTPVVRTVTVTALSRKKRCNLRAMRSLAAIVLFVLMVMAASVVTSPLHTIPHEFDALITPHTYLNAEVNR